MPENDTVTITVPRAAAESLRKHWESGCSNLNIVMDVRDLFGGRDGYLPVLSAALDGEH